MRFEDPGGLDAAGGELRDEAAIGGEEVVIAEFLGENPRRFFEGAGRDVAFRDLHREEVDFEFIPGLRVGVMDAADFLAVEESDVELFAEFARQGLFGRFAGLHFAAGEFPLERRGVRAATLPDEEPAIGALDDGYGDMNHKSGQNSKR